MNRDELVEGEVYWKDVCEWVEEEEEGVSCKADNGEMVGEEQMECKGAHHKGMGDTMEEEEEEEEDHNYDRIVQMDQNVYNLTH